jgi:DNA-binding NtrC family response regulator
MAGRRILSVSANTRLLVTRNDTLSLAGYNVVSPHSPEDTAELLARSHFDAVVIGHSVPADTRTKIIRAVRQIAPNVPVIFVYIGPTDDQEPLADFSVEVTDPVNLIRALENPPQ